MQDAGVRASGYTYSIMLSIVWCVWHGKEIHGNMIRHCLCLSNVVLANSLVDMYGKLGRVDYAFGVFLAMKELDTITWNSLIWGCHASRFGELASNKFCSMRSEGYLPDHFTLSTLITICSNIRNLKKGKQVLAVSWNTMIFVLARNGRVDKTLNIFKELLAEGQQPDRITIAGVLLACNDGGLVDEGIRIFQSMEIEYGIVPRNEHYAHIIQKQMKRIVE